MAEVLCDARAVGSPVPISTKSYSVLPPLLRLPEELLVMICADLEGRDLANATRVSRRLNPIATQHLYRDALAYTLPGMRYDLLHRTLTSKPSLRSFARSIALRLHDLPLDQYSMMQDLMAWLAPTTERFSVMGGSISFTASVNEIWGEAVGPVLCQMSNLRCLWVDWLKVPKGTLVSSLKCCRNLEELTIVRRISRGEIAELKEAAGTATFSKLVIGTMPRPDALQALVAWSRNLTSLTVGHREVQPFCWNRYQVSLQTLFGEGRGEGRPGQRGILRGVAGTLRSLDLSTYYMKGYWETLGNLDLSRYVALEELTLPVSMTGVGGVRPSVTRLLTAPRLRCFRWRWAPHDDILIGDFLLGWVKFLAEEAGARKSSLQSIVVQIGVWQDILWYRYFHDLAPEMKKFFNISISREIPEYSRSEKQGNWLEQWERNRNLGGWE